MLSLKILWNFKIIYDAIELKIFIWIFTIDIKLI